ncbi:hypothetical protein J1N35_001834 [Gossypium stocksii]|uniref:Uncharacterized protein n=1 Tax=Gossypium stocksii TaxID=47602 RepID=A0A9D4ALQ4_9ROSI|nr:hypothetical protein J1N35_001834 [Gossypium stocksii]
MDMDPTLNVKQTACEPIELPIRPLTHAQAQKFKEAITGIIDRVWGEVVIRLIDQAWACTPCVPYNMLQATL